MKETGTKDLLRLLAIESDPLALYAALNLEGHRSPEVYAAVEERIQSAGRDLADALLDRMEELEEEAPASDRLARVLAVGSADAQVLALGRWRDEVGEDLDEVVLHRLGAAPEAEAEDPHVLATLLGALVHGGDALPEEFSDTLDHALGHEDPRVRSNAAELASARCFESHKEKLFSLLSDPAPRVRASVARGLWPEAPGPVSKSLEADLESGDPRAVLAALHVLGRLDTYPDRRITLLRFSEHESSQVRLMALRSLAGVARELYGAELAEQYLAEESAACRRAIAELAAVSLSTKFMDALALVLAEDPEPRRRSLAAHGIAAMGGTDAVRILAQQVLDPEDRIRADVIEGLGQMDEPEVLPLLEHGLADPAPRVAANAALALWKRGGEDVVQKLLVWLRQDDAHAASSAAFALGEIGSEQVVGPLLEAAERLRDAGASSFGERALLKQIMKAIGKVRGT